MTITKEEWMKQLHDLKKCPDCNRRQRKPKKRLDKCENKDCESFIDTHEGVLYWNNPNWG